MAMYRFAGILNAARWPLIAALAGRTVIQPTYDAFTRERRGFGGTEESENNNLPQIIYCENALPTVEGIQSIGYKQIVAPTNHQDFNQLLILRDSLENNYLYCPGGGKNYFLSAATLTWSSVTPISGVTLATVVSRAYVNGRTFVYYAGKGIYEYAPGTPAMNAVALTLVGTGGGGPDITLAQIKGIGGSNNYLLLFTTVGVFWSSLTDPTNFTPSVSTGAGFATPQDVKGSIVAIQGTSGGFIVYTTRNAVAAQFTNNIRSPFVFKEIAGAGGIITNEQITTDTSSGVQYGWTTNGLQRITLQFAEVISAEVNDYIAGRQVQQWNANTGTLDIINSSAPEFTVKIALIANRWLCLSYTDDSVSPAPIYNYCLVYDLQLKRWGQLKIQHVDVFPLLVPTSGVGYTFTDLGAQTFNDLGTQTFNDLVSSNIGAGQPTSKREMAFLGPFGSISLALMDYNKDLNHSGVVIFGKHQLTRQRIMTHQLTIVEGAYTPDNFSAKIFNSLDGYNYGIATPLKRLDVNGRRITYAKRITGTNQSLIFQGTFALSSYLMEVTMDGQD